MLKHTTTKTRGSKHQAKIATKSVSQKRHLSTKKKTTKRHHLTTTTTTTLNHISQHHFSTNTSATQLDSNDVNVSHEDQTPTQILKEGEFSRIVYGPKATIPQIGLVERIISHANNPQRLFFQQGNKVYSYSDLLQHALVCREKIEGVLGELEKKGVKQHENYPNLGPRVCILAPSSFEYASYTLATWMSKGVAVPLHVGHPLAEMLHYLEDSKAKVIVAHPKYAQQSQDLLALFKKKNPTESNGVELLVLGEFETKSNPTDTPFVALEGINEDFRKIGPSNRDSLLVTNISTATETSVPLPSLDDPALFIYTSGTTNKPKGVVLTTRNLTRNITGMIQSWNWSQKDHILQFLPLHHVHGVVNVLYTAMWCGARVTAPETGKFNPSQVWDMILDQVNTSPQQSVLITQRDLKSLQNRHRFDQDMNLESGVHSSRIPALKHYPINYNLQLGYLSPPKPTAFTLFMAVPTIYHRLLEQYDQYPADKQALLTKACSQFRLMVSGSMALPQSTLNNWHKVSLHNLLERYGMSECGMAITNNYTSERFPGSIGWPLPGVNIRLKVSQGYEEDQGANTIAPLTEKQNTSDQPQQQKQQKQQKQHSTIQLSPTAFCSSSEEHHTDSDHPHGPNENNNQVTSSQPDIVGELLLQGHNVFGYYYNRPEQTDETFVTIPQNGPNLSPDGALYEEKWFATGDIARLSGKDGSIKLLGRNSVDILKIAGYKISALDVERSILEHPGVANVAVVGLPSESMGQSIAALVVPKAKWAENDNGGKALDFTQLTDFLQTNIPKYKIPREIEFVDSIPVNAMGKVNKKGLVKFLMEQPNYQQSKWRQ